MKERYNILKLYTCKLPLAEDVDLETIAKKTEGFSGRDLVEKLLKNALHKAIFSGSRVTKNYLEEALAEIKRKISEPKGMFA